MKIHKVTAVFVVVLGVSFMSQTAWSESSKHQQKRNKSNPEASSTTRFKTVAGTPESLPQNFKAIPEALKEISDGKPVVAWCGTGYLIDDGVAEKLLKHFETLNKYRQEIEKCSDDASKKLKGFLDEYVSKMEIANRSPENISAISKPFKSITGMDSALRFHQTIKDFLTKKDKEISSGKEKFEKADEALTKALDGIFKWCVAKDKEFTPSEDAQTQHQIDEFNAQVKKLALNETNACEMKMEEVSVAQNSSQAQDKPEKPVEPTTAPPTIEETPDQQASNSGGTGGVAQDQSASAQQPSGPAGASLPLPSAGAGFIPAQGDANLLNPDFLNEDTEREDELLNQLLQLAQSTQRPNESRVGGSPQRDNSRSFQFPPVSVSPQPGNQNQQPQQQQPYPQQPPFPYGAMMQQPPPMALPPELFAPRSTESNTRVNPMEAAQTQSLMEMARLQQQLMQAQMAAGANQQNQGRGNNVNRIRSGRSTFRGAQGSSQTRRYVGRGKQVSRSISRAR